jgi:hypothetical protein
MGVLYLITILLSTMLAGNELAVSWFFNPAAAGRSSAGDCLESSRPWKWDKLHRWRILLLIIAIICMTSEILGLV